MIGGASQLPPAVTCTEAILGLRISLHWALHVNAVVIDNMIKVILFILVMESEFYCYACIYLPSCEIVRHGVLLVCNISDPVVGVHVVDAQEIKSVNT